ncbi:copper resistance D family protein [Halobacillus massiliensis]|uniref:copper resistance D family protein n=1 Tax=Halobacillus massiliensis TaxID=1926286 RepID=UPI0015C4981A|nr:CopD family protein [Halobacillus massiliensis]
MLPKDSIVKTTITRKTLIVTAAFIPVLAAFPIIELAIAINEYQSGGLLESFNYVIHHIETGQAWAALVFLTLLFAAAMFLIKNTGTAYFTGLFILLGIILTQSVVGHSAIMASYQGALSHTLHLLAVCLWAGILLAVSWFSKNEQNWQAFVEWFTFMAVASIVFITFTGLIMTFTLTESIVSSWMLSYGQALLLKHILFIALLLFAFINGFLIRKKVQEKPSFSPRIWWRAESVIILLIFCITGFMTEQEPPHNIEQTLNRENASVLFQTFASVDIQPALVFAPNLLSLFFFILAGFFLFSIFVMFKKRDSAIGALAMAVIAVFSLYIGLMSSVTSG